MYALITLFFVSVAATGDVTDIDLGLPSDACTNVETAQKLLADHTVKDIDITSLLKDKTFTDVYRREKSEKRLDCAMTKYTFSSEHGLQADLLNTEHNSQQANFKETWTENKGLGTFNNKGTYFPKDKEPFSYVEDNVTFFHADEYVYGYFSCGLNSRFWRLVISIDKSKEGDQKALDSLKLAEKKMEELKSIFSEPIVKLKKLKCPGSV